MFPRPPAPFKYTLNVDQWKGIMQHSVDSKDCDAYEMYKLCVNSNLGTRNPNLYYTREEFNEAYDIHYSILFPSGNKRKR